MNLFDDIRRRLISSAFILLLVNVVSITVSADSPKLPTSGSQQMIVVTTSNWDAVQGDLQRYERDANSKWRKVGEKFQIVVGKKGLGWGEGLHDSSIYKPQQPIKREGDGKSPAGVFKLASIFGVADNPDFLKMPYTKLAETTECVDDVSSKNYNSIVDNKQVAVDWTSSEKMLSIGERYVWGVTVSHNSAPRQSGKGSCIFLHVWGDAQTGTSGCTAMKKENIETILRWLDNSKNPIFVQLPTNEFARLRKTWKLPTNK